MNGQNGHIGYEDEDPMATSAARLIPTGSLARNLSARNMSKVPASMITELTMKDRPPKVRGAEVIREARVNKGMAFNMRERQQLGIHGLLPPAFMTQDQQALRVVENLKRQPDDLARYIQLNELHDRNERLFYRVLIDNVDMLMPIVYTPTVGLACQKFGFIYRKPKGLYITIHDNSVEHIYEMLCNWPTANVRAIVVTDGERILGLGDLGAYGMGIPNGKLALYVALAGVQPEWCLPIVLDVGTNNPKLLNDPYYIGLRQERVRGEEYDSLIDNFMKAVVKRYGQDTLIQFEDFGNANAFRLLQKYKDKYCTFNDDIQGTASVAVSGIVSSLRITKHKMSEGRYLFYGAGIAELLEMAMEKEGLSKAEAKKRIFMVDSKGLITKTRTNLSEEKKQFMVDAPDMKPLLDIVKHVKPTALIGASTISKAFDEPIIREMGNISERPVIFALSNPTSKAECSAEAAYEWTEGRAIYASGSPFPAWTSKDGKTTFYPGQGNNAYIFPGVALAAILGQIKHITNEHFLIAAQTVADCVTEEHLAEGRVYPPLEDIREISIKIATTLTEHAYKNGTAKFYPEPEDKEAFVRAQLYDTNYADVMSDSYDWPDYAYKSYGEIQEGMAGKGKETDGAKFEL